MVNGSPAISYNGAPDRGLMYVRAFDAGGGEDVLTMKFDPSSL